MPVIIRQQEEAEQLLDMVAENLVRATPDPVSEVLHYRRLLQEPGMSRARLARETGVAPQTINDRLRLMELEPEIQDLIAAGRFPRGREPVEALLSIPDSRARVETARALAERRADVRLKPSRGHLYARPGEAGTEAEGPTGSAGGQGVRPRPGGCAGSRAAPGGPPANSLGAAAAVGSGSL